jgi:thiol-disulfide isomerase/thioredoxin
VTVRSLLAAAALIAAVGGCGGGGTGPTWPGGALTGLDGTPVTVEGPAVVNFWSPDCAPCAAEMPALERAHRRAGGQVRIVGVDVLGDADRARAFAARSGATYALVADPGGRLRQALGVLSLPTTVFLAPGGRVEATHAGTLTDAGLDRALARIAPAATGRDGAVNSGS